LPEPDSPTRPKHSPAATSKLTSCSTRIGPKLIESLSMVIGFMPAPPEVRASCPAAPEPAAARGCRRCAAAPRAGRANKGAARCRDRARRAPRPRGPHT